MVIVVSVGVVFIGCSKKERAKADIWNTRIKSAYQELCNKSINPTMTRIVHTEDGVWVYFKFENALMQESNSAMKFVRVYERWVRNVSDLDKKAVCK